MNKYRNTITESHGIKFHSKKEANRYQELLVLQKIGVISELKLQQRYPLLVNDVLVCTYVADFEYLDHEKKKLIVEDVKGVKTNVYVIKRKLFYATHGFNIFET